MTESLFAGRTFVVTGGSGGIGAAILRQLHKEGATPMCLDLTAPKDAPGMFVEVDVTDPVAVKMAVAQAVDETGRLDGAVACAGINRDRVHWKMTAEDWRSVLAINLDGAFHLLQAVTPHLRERGHGSLVFVSSINGERGKFGQANYAASKAGVIGLAKTAAKELGRYGVRVNTVSPGYIDTPMTKPLSIDVTDAAVAESVLGRIGTPDEVADAVLFLLSNQSSYITGHVLRVDGGQYI